MNSIIPIPEKLDTPEGTRRFSKGDVATGDDGLKNPSLWRKCTEGHCRSAPAVSSVRLDALRAISDPVPIHQPSRVAKARSFLPEVVPRHRFGNLSDRT
ncbi:MAG: hypothetical protein R6X18_02240 [Chloroflexota bacterium]|jgi:hypothetical protein